ncbi:MAG: HAD-IA family hydrolase [Lactobacillales bacterium]|jgi:phosphoglycolate phosphatase|nr:HAD-IA family hydrolase [Lactobacillales bacterium]
MYKAVIFDLDGTLIDTSEGIFNSVRFTEGKMGLTPLPNEKLVEFIGPKLIDSYMKQFNIDENTASKAVVIHREYGGSKGVYESSAYSGIKELIIGLHEKGIKLAVATMKPEEMAKKILAYFDLTQYFDEIIGMDTENKRNKPINIEIALKRMSVANSEAIMVGDSNHDAQGAKKVGVAFVAVTYGFGLQSEKELVDSAPVLVIHGTDELSKIEDFVVSHA